MLTKFNPFRKLGELALWTALTKVANAYNALAKSKSQDTENEILAEKFLLRYEIEGYKITKEKYLRRYGSLPETVSKADSLIETIESRLYDPFSENLSPATPEETYPIAYR